MVEAFTRSRTSPCPAAGTGAVRNSTVLSPGKKAAVIVSFMQFFSVIDGRTRVVSAASGRRDLLVDIPEIFPALVRLPEEDLPLDQAAVAVDACDLMHLFIGQRIAGGAL
jgi:hypothetical protein